MKRIGFFILFLRHNRRDIAKKITSSTAIGRAEQHQRERYKGSITSSSFPLICQMKRTAEILPVKRMMFGFLFFPAFQIKINQSISDKAQWRRDERIKACSYNGIHKTFFQDFPSHSVPNCQYLSDNWHNETRLFQLSHIGPL